MRRRIAASVEVKPRRTQVERSATTREALVRAAIDVICELGYAATTTTLIAERAKVTRGAVQHHFGSREDFILAVIDSALKALNFDVNIDEFRGLPLEKRVSTLVDRYRNVYSQRFFIATLDIWMGVRDEPELAEKLRLHLVEAQNAIAQMWLEVFSDVKISRARIVALRRIVNAAISGFAIQEHLGLLTNWEEASRELREMMAKHLASFQ
jgi:AcrR family transcriptional regulator